MLDVRASFAVQGLFAPETARRLADGWEVRGWVLGVGGGPFRADLRALPRSPGRVGAIPGRWRVFDVERLLGRGSEDERARARAAALSALQVVAGRLDVPADESPGGAPPHGGAAFEREFHESETGGDVPAELAAAAHDGPWDVLRLHVRLRAACLQACRFCPQRGGRAPGPAEWNADLAFLERLAERVFRPARARGVAVEVGLDANDLAAHGRLADALALVNRECGCPMHLVVPGNRLAAPAVASALARQPGMASIAVTLFGSTAATHDDVAGRKGAFVETLRALHHLDSEGVVETQLHVVLTAGAVGDEVGGLLDLADRRNVPLTIRFPIADCEAHLERLRPLMPRLDRVREAFARREADALRVAPALMDFPRCALPDRLVALARNEHPREALAGQADPPICRTCAARPRCVGVSRAYIDAHGTAGLAPG